MATAFIIPGLHDSGPDHWQLRRIASRDDRVRVELVRWHEPDIVGVAPKPGDSVITRSYPFHTYTSDWLFAVLPSDDAYCGATPTE